jgi:hypothetical protein
VYVGEPFQLRLSVLTKTWFTKAISLDDPAVPLGIVRRIGRSVAYTDRREGQALAVSDRRYLVWPNGSGTIEVAPQTIRTASPPEGGSTSEPVEVRSPAVSVEVLPPRDGFDPALWLTAVTLTVDHSWDKAISDLKVGDATRFEITLVAEGSISALLPKPTAPTLTGFSFTEEPPVLRDEMGERTNTATRTDRWTFIAQEAGTFQVPAMTIRWWDYDDESSEEVVIPAFTLDVAENPDLEAGLVSTPDTAADVGADTSGLSARWWWPPSIRLLAGSVLLLILIVVGFRAGRSLRNRESAASPSAASPEEMEEKAFQSLEDAIASGDALEVRSRLMLWLDLASLYLPSRPAADAWTAIDFAEFVGDDELRSSFSALDEALFSAHTPGPPIAHSLLSSMSRRMRKARSLITAESASALPASRALADASARDLPPLNPTT